MAEQMIATARDRTITFYDRLLDRYGDCPEAVGWSPENQAKRFAALASIGDLRQASVADFGCGRGDLADWLLEHGGCASYVGYDCHPRLLEWAHVAHPAIPFVLTDAIERVDPADYVILSGVLNLKANYDAQAQWQWMIKTLAGAYARARRGVAFNCLSVFADPSEQDASQFYTDPHRLLAVCLRLTKQVRFVHWDLPRNITVHLLK